MLRDATRRAIAMAAICTDAARFGSCQSRPLSIGGIAQRRLRLERSKRAVPSAVGIWRSLRQPVMAPTLKFWTV